MLVKTNKPNQRNEYLFEKNYLYIKWSVNSFIFYFEENDLRWEDNSEERIEISSESSGGGVPSNTQQPPSTQNYTHEIWKRDEIENSLKNLPGADYIIEIVSSENLISMCSLCNIFNQIFAK